MAQLITVRLNKSDQQPLGFRLQGGKDFGTPLVVQKVNGGSAAERAGLQAGDALIRVNTTDVYTLRHQEAQDAIRAGGGNLELTVQRGGGTWRPSVTPTGSLPRPGSRPLGSSPAPVTNTSLKATPQPSRAFGSGHNNVAKPFGYMNGNDSVKSIVNKQYNTPVSMYSDKTIAETLSAQTEVLAGGVLGVNFKKNEKTYDAEKSAVFKVLQEAENDPEPVSEATPSGVSTPVSGLRHVSAPVTRDPPINNTGGLPPGQNICEDCERLITGVFVRIKDKNLHVECFKCATCGSSLKNQGYYNLNGKLYCDIHAKLVAKQNPPAPNLDPVTVPPGGRLPTNAYSTPLPPLSTNNYTNGSSSMFSPSSNLSGPKPFGSSLGTYSPASLSPRSAPLSPRAPPPALAPPAPHVHAPAPAPVQTFAPTKNVKSIVWPPPNPPEDEPESEANTNVSNIDITSEERICSNTNTSNVSDIQIKSTEQVIPPSTQTMEFSSNASYDSTQMASSTIKSQTAIQQQRSEMKQEISSCTVQSYSQQASESEQFSVYQSHIASDELNKKIQNMERQVREEHNILPSKFKTGENIQQYNMKNSNVNVSSFKTQPYSEKINNQKILSKDIPMPMPAKVPKPGTRAPVARKPFNAAGQSSQNPPPKKPTLQRGSLLEALTIAPDRPYSPLSFHLPSMQYSNLNAEEGPSLLTEVAPPPAPSTSNQSSINQSNQSCSKPCSTQNTGFLQSSSQMSAFKPVCKQTFPPPHPEELSSQVNYPAADIDNQKLSHKEFSQSNQETLQESKLSESMAVTSINTAQNYSEQSDKQESSAFVRTESGLHRPDSIPPYQQAIVPEIYNPGLLQTTHTPSNKVTNKTSLNIKNKDTSESLTFQPVVDETSLRISPARSRPTTPSMINKPAPIIPHYQMNLVTMEHLAPESRLYNPSSTDASRSSTPLARSRSPAPQQSFKAQAPRIKPMPLQSSFQQTQSQNTQLSNYKQEQEFAATGLLTQASNKLSASGVQNYIPNQPTVIKDESQSNVEYHTEKYNKGDMNIKEDSMLNQNYGERPTESQNISEYGNTTVQTTKKTFEEFESASSAKVIEIRKGGSQSSGSNQQIESNIQPINNNLRQVFPPPISNMTPPQQNLPDTNDSVVNASKRPQIYQPTPFISGANQGPVCDPTPSTGSSVGAAARGKAFGVSSAPKRGRGVLNKAALPGSRVPLCGSCNGNIRGPFITALGRIWCPEHFICVNATCRRQLQDIGFVEENGQLYCEFCFEQYIAPPCDKCHNKIKEDCLNAIGKHFHPECFSCVYCGKLFGNNPFFLEDGLPYCEADWNELFTTKCFACGFPVEAGDRWVEALNNNYHSQCFNCTVCKKNLQGQSFFAKGGRPFCKSHAR